MKFTAGRSTRNTTKTTTMDINNLRTDEAAEKDGVWIDYTDGARFKIRSADFKGYRAKLTKLARKHSQAAIKRNPDVMRDIIITAMAEEIVIGWDGLKDEGKEFPFSVENATKLLRITPIRDFISEQALDLENFRREALDGEADAIKSGD